MLRIREADPADASAIATLHADSWRANYRGAYRDEYLDGDIVEERIQVWEKRFAEAPANQFVTVAEQGSEMVGFACAYGADDEIWGTLLDNLHVRTELHSRGTGTHLVAEVADWCRASFPDCGLYLWVLEQNTRARRFYERLGASDRGGEISEPAGGGQIHGRRYAWTTVPEIARP